MEGDPMNKLPDISDEHILERIGDELADIEAEDSIYKTPYFGNAPIFNDGETRLIGVLMVLRPNQEYSLDYQSLPKVFSVMLNDNFTDEDKIELIEAIDSLRKKGILEQRVIDGKEHLLLTEIGAIIYKMWQLAGKLMR